jgi:hypothetical protein
MDTARRIMMSEKMINPTILRRMLDIGNPYIT